MTEITQGVDCTRRLKKPRYRLRLQRRTIHAQPSERLALRLLEVPAECSASCYVWRHVRGGGYLEDEIGEAVWFRAPSSNVGCEGSAIITVSCGEEHLDTVFIGSASQVTPPEILTWFRKNRTYPSPPLEYTRYYATAVESTTLYERKIFQRPGFEEPFFLEDPLREGELIEPGYVRYVTATGDPLPEGIIRETGARWPRDWKVGDPAPEGFTIPEGTQFPEAWSYFITFPLKKHLYRCWRMYDCNGIYLNMWHYTHFGEGTTHAQFVRVTEIDAERPLIRDARSPFLKGERVVLAEGATIPFGWKPDSRGVRGLTIPGGTIWPPDWKIGDPFPEWDCCPATILQLEEF